MSRNDWERGELVLPRAAVVPIRRALIAENNRIADEALTLAKKVWGEATAKEKANSYFMDQKIFAAGGTVKYGFAGREVVDNDVTDRAREILGTYGRGIRPPQKKNAGHLGATTTSFRAGEAHVFFDNADGKMTWSTGDNNHAVERAHESWLGKTLFPEIAKVEWTRNTGGWLTGNDEYNEESREHGAGANYVTNAYGPIGAENHPMQTREYTKSDGTRVTSKELSAMQTKQWAAEARAQARFANVLAGGSQGRVGRGTTAGGQYAAKHNSAPTSFLR